MNPQVTQMCKVSLKRDTEKEKIILLGTFSFEVTDKGFTWIQKEGCNVLKVYTRKDKIRYKQKVLHINDYTIPVKGGDKWLDENEVIRRI